MLPNGNKIYEFDGFRLDVHERTLSCRGERLHLADKAFDLLCALADNSGKRLSKNELLEGVWTDSFVEENTLDKNISLLRRLLSDARPGVEFIETVRGHGYRFVAPLTEIAPLRDRAGNGIDAAPSSLAVLPFTNFENDPKIEYFCEGLVEELINSLAKVHDLKVAARTSTFSFKGKQVPIAAIARTLDVENVLEGSLRKEGDAFFATVRLIDGRSGYAVWSEQYHRPVSEIFAMQDEIALAIIGALNLQMTTEERNAVLKRPTASSQAYLLYLRGQYYRWRPMKESFSNALKYFERSVKVDPKFARGYFGISTYFGYGGAWGLLSMPPERSWPLAEAAARKAIDLDPGLHELRLSFAAFDLVDHRKLDAAEVQICAIAADHPNLPEIHHIYSFLLAITGRFDEAIEEARRALSLDPLSVLFSRFVGSFLYYARRYGEAVTQLLDAAELDPNNPKVHEALFEVYYSTGQFEDAVDSWVRVAHLEGDDAMLELLPTKVRNGRPGGDKATIRLMAQRKLEKLASEAEGGSYVPSIHFARHYIFLNDYERAIEWLERASRERNAFSLLIGIDPLYDPLRNDTRFVKLWEYIRTGDRE